MSRTIRIGFLLVAVSSLILWPTPASAQRHRVYVGVGYGYYYPFFWGGYGWYPSPWFYPPYPYYAFPSMDDSAARLLVTPRETEVYLDGYLVGTVDDFDGFAQRLRVRPGEHEIRLYLEGHKTVSQTLLFRPGETYKISHVMEPLPDGEPSEPRPSPSPVQASAPPSSDPGLQSPPERGSATARTAFGTIAIRVQPSDAEIFIDGERWQAPDGASRLVVEVPEGRHRIEVRKNGYETYAADVDVRRGAVSTVNVSLLTEDREV